MSLIYVAGSGPSSSGHRKAHVVTKKKVHWDYEHIVLPRSNWVTDKDRSIVWEWYENKTHWEKYYSRFKPTKLKPSNGLQAVFVAIDKYSPDEICLLGFDNVLDGFETTQHDWRAERRCIESLVKIIDPRPGLE